MGPGVIARTAARWWADQLRNHYEPQLDRDGVPAEQKDPLAIGLMSMAHDAARKHVTPEKVDHFEAALARLMQEELDGKSTAYFFAMKFSTDYGPGTGLSEALEEAGMPSRSSSILPIKTTMWADKEGVRVAAGYAAGIENVPLLPGDPVSEPPR